MGAGHARYLDGDDLVDLFPGTRVMGQVTAQPRCRSPQGNRHDRLAVAAVVARGPGRPCLADRHYNRQARGRAVRPARRCLVLLTADRSAVWVTSWPLPQYVRHAWPGAWVCSLFRNERPDLHLSSDLITRVAHTRAHWPAVPAPGFVTFVDPAKTRRKRDPGRCFRRAGWQHAGFTAGGLYVLQQSPPPCPHPPRSPGRSPPCSPWRTSHDRQPAACRLSRRVPPRRNPTRPPGPQRRVVRHRRDATDLRVVPRPDPRRGPPGRGVLFGALPPGPAPVPADGGPGSRRRRPGATAGLR